MVLCSKFTVRWDELIQSFSHCEILLSLCWLLVLWILRQGVVSTPWPVDQLQPAVCFYFFVLLNPVTPACLHIVCGCLHIVVIKLSSWNRGSVVWTYLCLALYRKLLPAPAWGISSRASGQTRIQCSVTSVSLSVQWDGSCSLWECELLIHRVGMVATPAHSQHPEDSIRWHVLVTLSATHILFCITWVEVPRALHASFPPPAHFAVTEYTHSLSIPTVCLGPALWNS